MNFHGVSMWTFVKINKQLGYIGRTIAPLNIGQFQHNRRTQRFQLSVGKYLELAREPATAHVNFYELYCCHVVHLPVALLPGSPSADVASACTPQTAK